MLLTGKWFEKHSCLQGNGAKLGGWNFSYGFPRSRVLGHAPGSVVKSAFCAYRYGRMVASLVFAWVCPAVRALGLLFPFRKRFGLTKMERDGHVWVSSRFPKSRSTSV